MSKHFIVSLFPVVSIVALVVGCGTTTPETDATDPLPRLFDNKDVSELPIPAVKGRGPGSGTGMGGGMGKGQLRMDDLEPPPGSKVESAPEAGKPGAEIEKKESPGESADPAKTHSSPGETDSKKRGSSNDD